MIFIISGSHNKVALLLPPQNLGFENKRENETMEVNFLSLGKLDICRT